MVFYYYPAQYYFNPITLITVYSTSQSLIDVVRSLSTSLGTASVTIIAFYFGIREKTAIRLSKESVIPDLTFPTIVHPNPPDRSQNVTLNSLVSAKFSEPYGLFIELESAHILYNSYNIVQ